MNKKNINLMKKRIKECEDDIYFYKIFNDDSKSDTNIYIELNNLMNSSDEKQAWLKNIYKDNLQDIKKESDEDLDSIKILKEEIFILKKMISEEKKLPKKVVKKNRWLIGVILPRGIILEKNID